MLFHVLSTACDIICSNGNGQLCPLTYAKWSGLSNHTRMSTIQSRTPQKNAKNHVTLTWKSCSIAHLPSFSSNPNILKPFPPKWSLLNAQQEKKKWGKKGEKRGEERKINFAFCACPTSRADICIWIRRSWSVRPVTRFVVSFSS